MFESAGCIDRYVLNRIDRDFNHKAERANWESNLEKSKKFVGSRFEKLKQFAK